MLTVQFFFNKIIFPRNIYHIYFKDDITHLARWHFFFHENHWLRCLWTPICMPLSKRPTTFRWWKLRWVPFVWQSVTPPPFEKSWLSPCKLYIVYGITFLFDTLLLSLKVGTVTDAIFISGVPSSPDGRKTQFCGNLLSSRHFKNLKIDWTTDQT